MRRSIDWSFVLLLAAVAGCRGEPVPRDYQNSPPAVTHPVTSSSETPDAHGMPGASAEPTSGAEGKNVARQPTSGLAGTSTIRDQAPSGSTATTVAYEPGPPAANSQHATQTTATAVTGTHLATPP